MKIKVSFSPAKISNFLKKYHFWILGAILLLLLCFNAFIYYQHVYLIMNTKVIPTDSGIVIDQEILDKVTDQIDQREDNLKRVETEDYFNPFSD